MSKNSFINLTLRLLTWVAQWLLAATFLFSGFAKALDPMGMEHKLEAYCAAWGLPIMAGSLYLDVAAILLALVEFSLGIYLLLGIRQRLASIGTLLFMVFMTLVTVYIYLYNPVTDCGCFGDALILTNGQTLAKNIVLLACALLLVWQRKRSLRIISEHNQWILSLYSMLYMLGVSVYSLHYQPLMDFTGFELGTDINEAMRGEFSTTFTYEKNGEKRTFGLENLPDSTWKYVDAQTEVLKEPSIKEFSITSRNGDDLSEEILADTSYVFIATLPKISMADAGCSDALNDIYDFSNDHHHRFLCATTGTDAEITGWIDRTGASYPFVKASSELLKEIVRSNPGLVLLKKGRILAKWGRNDMPDEKELTQITASSDDEQRHRRNHSFGLLFLWFVVPCGVVFLLDRLWMGRRFYKIHHHYKSQKNNVPQ